MRQTPQFPSDIHSDTRPINDADRHAKECGPVHNLRRHYSATAHLYLKNVRRLPAQVDPHDPQTVDMATGHKLYR